MDLKPEIASNFEGKRLSVEVCADGTAHVVHPVGAADGGPWLDLEEDGATRQRLRRMGIGRARWNGATKDNRDLLRRICDAQELQAHAARALLGVAPQDAPPDLASKAEVLLRGIVETSEKLASHPSGFNHALDRHLFHPHARLAVHPLTKVLREAKREARAGTRSRFADPEWQKATASAVNNLLASYALAQICAPQALARLKTEAPSASALALLSQATGLSEDDLRRDAARQNRGQRPLP